MNPKIVALVRRYRYPGQVSARWLWVGSDDWEFWLDLHTTYSPTIRLRHLTEPTAFMVVDLDAFGWRGLMWAAGRMTMAVAHRPLPHITVAHVLGHTPIKVIKQLLGVYVGWLLLEEE